MTDNRQGNSGGSEGPRGQDELNYQYSFEGISCTSRSYCTYPVRTDRALDHTVEGCQAISKGRGGSSYSQSSEDGEGVERDGGLMASRSFWRDNLIITRCFMSSDNTVMN